MVSRCISAFLLQSCIVAVVAVASAVAVTVGAPANTVEVAVTVGAPADTDMMMCIRLNGAEC